jgi:hypothetical protein
MAVWVEAAEEDVRTITTQGGVLTERLTSVEEVAVGPETQMRPDTTAELAS